ncbi:SMI1/KNR4 family protein [Streptomyces sp. TRM66268-LWL]|uniref:SMI1/KNR4 family protein n=1 Tax=Streptomyces polyasparticus TaxID=2767826 RepID=A0ABR7SL21_9ACTN|nr:SMI1/KNR4 family protein [Streptomyces polyasparticus]MBC9716175.1 SMI1/KNR4 family protein [Streptomyces polyasparticus]
MTGPEAVDALSRVVPTAGGRDERIDWSAVEAVWGTRFPSDYVRFMEVYGAGSFAGTVSIQHPEPDVDGYYADGSGLDDETENARYTWETEGEDAGFALDPKDIVAWGVTAGADIYCWLTTDENPDRWPVLVCGRHTTPVFQLHPYGMGEFLRRLFGDAEFREETLSVVIQEPVDFVNWRTARGL